MLVSIRDAPFEAIVKGAVEVQLKVDCSLSSNDVTVTLCAVTGVTQVVRESRLFAYLIFLLTCETAALPFCLRITNKSDLLPTRSVIKRIDKLTTPIMANITSPIIISTK